MIDLRKEFNGLIDEYGYYVLLQRTSRKVHCRCWHEKEQEADSYCSLCLGTGWVSKIERHKVTSKNGNQPISKPNLLEQTPIGKTYVPAEVFYFKHDVRLAVGDLVYLVGWKGNIPTNLMTTFRISHVETKRGNNGRIEYQLAAVKAEIMDKPFKGFMIRSLGPVKNYEPYF